jgi:hypothetical protein
LTRYAAPRTPRCAEVRMLFALHQPVYLLCAQVTIDEHFTKVPLSDAPIMHQVFGQKHGNDHTTSVSKERDQRRKRLLDWESGARSDLLCM